MEGTECFLDRSIAPLQASDCHPALNTPIFIRPLFELQEVPHWSDLSLKWITEPHHPTQSGIDNPFYSFANISFTIPDLFTMDPACSYLDVQLKFTWPFSLVFSVLKTGEHRPWRNSIPYSDNAGYMAVLPQTRKLNIRDVFAIARGSGSVAWDTLEIEEASRKP